MLVGFTKIKGIGANGEVDAPGGGLRHLAQGLRVEFGAHDFAVIFQDGLVATLVRDLNGRADGVVPDADGDEADAGGAEFLGGGDGQGVMVLAIGDEDDVLVLFFSAVEDLFLGETERISQVGAAPGDRFGGEVGQHHAEEAIVLCQRTLYDSIPREGDQRHAVTLKALDALCHVGLGSFQSRWTKILG